MSFPLFVNSIANVLWIILRMRNIFYMPSIRSNDYYYPGFVLVYYTLTDLVPIGWLAILHE